MTAGLAAGAIVFAYVPHGDADVFRRARVAEVFSDMADLPAVLGEVDAGQAERLYR